MTSARRRSQSSQRSRSERHASRQRRRRSVQLAAERLEPRAMLATTATLSGNTAPYTLMPVTFRQLDGSVGFSGQAYVGQLSWSGMSGDAAALGVPSSFTSFCINGLRDVYPGTVTFPQFATDLADFPYGVDSIDTARANLLESFWRQYGPATAAGFTDKTDSAAFQLAVWEIINDGALNGSRLSFNLAAGQFSVAAAGLTLPAAARAQQWLAGYDTAGIDRNRVDLYALWHPTLQPQVVPVFNPITITATNAIASEDPSLGPDRGEFVISRGEGNVTGDLQVAFRVPATVSAPLSIASLGADYTLSVGGAPISLSASGEGTVTIPAGKSSVSIRLAVEPDAILEWDETARVELLPAPTGSQPYGIVPNRASADVTILDDELLGGMLSRNVDGESTGLSASTVGLAAATIDLAQGEATVSLPLVLGGFGPRYTSHDNLRPIVALETQLPLAGTGSVTATLTFGGIASETVTFTNVPANETVRFVLLGSDEIRSRLSTGRYDYDIALRDAQGRVRTIRGATEVVNRVEETFGEVEFGRRWWLPLLDRLVPGDGTTAWYAAKVDADAAILATEGSADSLWKSGTASGGRSRKFHQHERPELF